MKTASDDTFKNENLKYRDGKVQMSKIFSSVFHICPIIFRRKVLSQLAMDFKYVMIKNDIDYFKTMNRRYFTVESLYTFININLVILQIILLGQYFSGSMEKV